MARSNITGETANNVALTSLPTVDIPENFKQNKQGYLIFQIATTDGDVQVEGWRWGFSCKGTSGALAACGLLQIDWIPGIPGNNSVRQTVAFIEGNAIPLRGRRNGVRNPAQSLIITRLSRVRYEVRVPTTKAQQDFIYGIQERHERKAKEEETAAAYKPISPGEFRNLCLRLVDNALGINQSEMEVFGFTYNKESTARINRAFSELRNAFAEGGIVQGMSGLRRDGNVIYLGYQPAG